MACYFKIKNVKGGQDIILEAFDLLSKDDPEIKKLLTSSLTTEDLEKIQAYFRKKTPLHTSTIKSIVDTWYVEKGDLIDSINNAIINSGNETTLEEALLKYLNEKDRSTGKSQYVKRVNELKRVLSIPDKSVEYKLFSQLSSITSSLASTSLKEEISSLNSEIRERKTYFEPTFFEEEMKIFLRAANEKLGWENTETLIKVGGNKLEGGYWNFENLTVYSDDPLRSNLFLALFKRIGGNINYYKLQPTFNKINELLKANKYSVGQIEGEDVFKFFNGVYDEKKGEQLEDSAFDGLFKILTSPTTSDKVRTQLVPLVEDIINTVATDIKLDYSEDTARNLAKTIGNLFWRLYPESFGSNKLKQKLFEEEKLNSAVKKSIENSLRSSVEQLDSLSKRRNNNEDRTGEIYDPPAALIDKDLYLSATDNLIVGKDLVKLPFEKGGSINKYSPYWVVTGIYDRKNGSVKVYGARINQNGDFEKRDFVFKSGDSIIYRKHNPLPGQEYVENEAVLEALPNNSALVIIKDGIPNQIAREIVTKGDRIGNDIVLAVYPGYILTRNPKGIIRKKYFKSTTTEVEVKKEDVLEDFILSKNAFNLITEEAKVSYDKLVLLDDPNLISTGDYFKTLKDAFYKKALFSDDKNVWYWIKDARNGYVIKSEAKENIIEARASFLGDVNNRFVSKVAIEHNARNSRAATLSSFENIDLAKTGDLFVIEKPNGNLYGKVLDKSKNWAVVWDSTVRRVRKINYKEESNKNIVFYSEDNRLSENFTYNLLANFWNVQVLNTLEGEPDPNKYTKVEYVLPEDFDPDKVKELFPGSLYFQVGRYITSDYLKDQVSYNNHILGLLALDPTSNGLYVKRQTLNELERNYEGAGLKRIEGFDSIDKNFLKSEGLFPGVYFSVYTEGNIDWNIYRVEKVDDINNLVHARIYKINDAGNIIMSEKTFDKDILAAPKTGNLHVPGSIARYYLQKGNNNFAKIVMEANKQAKVDKAERKSQKQINEIKKKLENSFKDLGISIIQSNDTFEAGQKAKFEINSEGIAYIMLNNDFGGPEDLVHEGLHVFLTALRYQYPDVYDRLINSVTATERGDSILEKEEIFMSEISKDMLEGYTGEFLNTGKIGHFIEAFQVSRDFLSGESTRKQKTVGEILSTKISDFIGVPADNSHPLFNLNLAQVEPMFRRWMEEENVLLNCK